MKSTLETKRLILRPWRESDAPMLYKFGRDKELALNCGWNPHASVEESLDVIKNILMLPEVYAICLKSGELVGCISIVPYYDSKLCTNDTQGEIGYWVGRPFQKRGYATEAARAVINHAFKDLRLQMVMASFFDGNKGSSAILENCGFRYGYTVYNAYWELTKQVRTIHTAYLLPDDFYYAVKKLG